MNKLETTFCGLTLPNPVIVPAGVHGRSAEVIREVGESGVSAICTKTIVSQAAPDVLPCFGAVKAGMVNAVFGSDRPSTYWFTEGIRGAKEGKAKVIANLAGFSPAESAELAAKAEEAGADMIEIPTHCPHMGEILMAMFPGMEMPEPALTDVKPMQETVRLVKEAVKIPVVVKLSGTFSNITKIWAKGVEDSGADGIACSDAVGPALAVDIHTGQPLLGGPRGIGGLTGPAIMPLTLRMVLEIAMTTNLPIVGVGGVSSAEDIIQYVMAGATLVGVCTAGHLGGMKKYASIIADLEKLVDSLGFKTLADARGLTVRRIEERKKNGKVAWTKPVVPTVSDEKCTGCGKCVKSCAYDAISVESGIKKARIVKESCIGCGLCVSVCPERALTQVYY